MNSCYLEDTDGTDRVYFEIDPEYPPSPIHDRIVMDFTSAVSFSGSTIVIPQRSFLDCGVPTYGGVITVGDKYMTLTTFALMYAKFTANPPVRQRFYDARRLILYSSVLLRSFTYEYNTGSQIVNWKMDLIVS